MLWSRTRAPKSQQLLIPETFDLTPAQAAVFDDRRAGAGKYGFELMRLVGTHGGDKSRARRFACRRSAQHALAEILDTVDAEKKGSARETLRDDIAASLACHAAIKVNMPLTPEKMRWLIDRLLKTSSPTTCPHGRPVILRLTLATFSKASIEFRASVKCSQHQLDIREIRQQRVRFTCENFLR